MLWVVPPFLALTLSLVLRLSARVKSHRRRPAGVRPGDAAADHGRLQPVDRRPLRRRPALGLVIGAVAWVARRSSASGRGMPRRHPRPPPRRRRRAAEPATGAASRARRRPARRCERNVEPGDGPVGVADDAVGVDDERRAPVEAERAEDAVGLARPPCRRRPAAGRRSRPARRRSRSWLSTDCGLMASTWAPTSANASMSVGVGVQLAGADRRVVARVEDEHHRLAPVAPTACSRADPSSVPSRARRSVEVGRRRRRPRRTAIGVSASIRPRGSTSGMSKLA